MAVESSVGVLASTHVVLPLHPPVRYVVLPLLWSSSLIMTASATGSAERRLADACAASCNHGDCVNGACECDTGYTGSYCDSFLIDGIYTESFEDPAVIVVLSVLCLIILVLAGIIVYLFRLQYARSMGPFGKVVQQVMRGHESTSKDDLDHAAVMYHSAILSLCSNKLTHYDNVAELAAQVDEVLAKYNCSVYYSVKLAFWMRARPDSVPMEIPVNFQEGLKVELDKEHRVSAAPEGSAAAQAGLAVGDALYALDGAQTCTLAEDALREKLMGSGVASFHRAVPAQDPPTRVCSRCASRNTIDDEARSIFSCYSCRATVVPFEYLAMSPDVKPRRMPMVIQRLLPCLCQGAPVTPLKSTLSFEDVRWEDSGLQTFAKHPLGFGRPRDLPDGCVHHTQSGATCGMAAVNNLITNCDRAGLDVEGMLAIADRLGQAEQAIRDGAQSVEEGGEEQQVLELYATAGGEHFDVQTLQLALSEVGFHMWYAPSDRLRKSDMLFEYEDEVAGYILHRKDPVNNKFGDHWFVLRRHGDSPGQLLLQDSLFSQPFELTLMEAHQMLLSMPAGSLFVVTVTPSS